MAESWHARLLREAREMDAALRTLWAAPPTDDKVLREQLEALAQRPRFAEFTWFWGPALAERNRVLFRPFILSHFSSLALDAKGRFFDAWKGKTAAPLERWLQSVDAIDDVELTRRLFGWRLAHTPWRKREHAWREEVVRRFSSATSPASRATALAKVDTGWMSLDAKTAVALYDRDHTAARAFILSHLPWFGWLGETLRDWDALLRRSRDQDADFHFDLYRRVIDEKQWRVDVLALCRGMVDAATLDAELERRHPRSHFASTAEVFHELVRARRRDVVPYVLRHVSSIHTRWGVAGRQEAKGLPALLQVSRDEGWLDLWAALLRTAATDALFDAEVKRLVQTTELPESETRMRLSLLAGHGRETHFPGLSFAQVHALKEDTALELYRRFPELVRGPFRMHIAPGWHSAYPRVVGAAIDHGDHDFIDFLAAQAGLRALAGAPRRDWNVTLDSLTSYFEALAPTDFVARACNALARMPAFAVWDYDGLLRTNRLARLLFERSTALYLSDDKAVRDLLESPQIYVQALAFRILGRDDPRARAIAAQNADLLQATLFRPLHRRTRLLAFGALDNASKHDEATSRYLLGRMREALTLPEKRYPTEKLIGLIGALLHRWPSLRGAGEAPRVYGEVGA